ncbi:MAG: hypothetical protein ACI9SK_000971 [Zhongshania sp.]|jgi:hypothetical protein
MTNEVLRRFAAEEMAAKARSLPDGFLDKTVKLGLKFMSIPEAQGDVGAGRHPLSSVLTIAPLAQGDISMADSGQPNIVARKIYLRRQDH